MQVLNAGSYDDEYAWNMDTDKVDNRKIKITCPNCNRSFAALCSLKTKMLDSGWRWVGCDHKEPYANFETTCSCGVTLLFDVYTGQ